MSSFGLLADALVLGATVKIMKEATEPIRERDNYEENGGGLGFFNKW